MRGDAKPDEGPADSCPPDAAAANASELLGLLSTRLYRQAELEVRRQPPGHTLQATALLNEVYRATQVGLERSVAVKEPSLGRDPSAARPYGLRHRLRYAG